MFRCVHSELRWRFEQTTFLSSSQSLLYLSRTNKFSRSNWFWLNGVKINYFNHPNWPRRLKTRSLAFRPLQVQKLYFVNAEGSLIYFFFLFSFEENDQTLPRQVCARAELILRDMLVCWKNRGDLSTVSVPICDVGLHSSGLQRALDPVHKGAAVHGATRAGKGPRGCTACTTTGGYHHSDPQRRV